MCHLKKFQVFITTEKCKIPCNALLDWETRETSQFPQKIINITFYAIQLKDLACISYTFREKHISKWLYLKVFLCFTSKRSKNIKQNKEKYLKCTKKTLFRNKVSLSFISQCMNCKILGLHIFTRACANQSFFLSLPS